MLTIRPVSQVFDYEYFLNNWGWWWGNTITGNGGQRANWDFDVRQSPTVNGVFFASDLVEENKEPMQNLSYIPFHGKAETDVTNLVHQGAPRLTMPNLLDFTNYIATAMANTSSNGLWVGSNQIVFGVLTNKFTPHPGGITGNLSNQTGLYVVGTPSAPITIKGTVVVHGDVIIQGKITGQGALYVGGNLYIANDVTYNNGPKFDVAPETLADADRDNWVYANTNKDLIAFAVRGSILAGDVTDADWINYCMNMDTSGLIHVGDESALGQDGISGTGDDNIPFLHADGTMGTWYDDDGDGIITTGNYNYNRDINMTASRASYILGYPKDNTGAPVPYGNVATDNMGTLQGIFYTDHAAAMRLNKSTVDFSGSIISRNEQIIFSSVLNFTYDSRVHSRYANNPNQFINLGLPWGKPLQVNTFVELAPDGAGL